MSKIISEHYRQVLKAYVSDDAQYRSLTDLVEKIIQESTREIQVERDNALDYLNQTGNILVALDITGNITFVNQSIHMITGYLPEEITGKNWFDIFIPEGERETIEQIHGEVVAGNIRPMDSYENYILTKSGEKRLIAWRNTFRTDPETGKIIGSYSSGEDITVRRGIEESLQENELRYRQMFHANNAVKLVLDPATGDIVEANQAAVDFYGYDHETLTGMNIGDINPLPREQLMTEEQRVLSEKRVYQFQHRLADGTIRNVETYTGPINLEGKDLQYSIILDVTEREKAKVALQLRESQFRTAVSHIPNGMMMMFDTTMKCIIARGQELFTGIDSPEELEGHYLAEALPGSVWAHAREMYEKALMGESSQQYFENEDRHVMVQVEPLYDDDKNIIGGLHLFQNISHLRRFERIIKDTQEQLNTILDGVVDGVAVISPDERLLYANDAVARITGFKNGQDMMAKTRDNLIIEHSVLDEDGNELPFEQQTLYLALQGDTPPAQVVIFKNKQTGQEIWAEAKAKPILDDKGNVRFAVIILNDITRAKKIEKFKLEALQEQTQIKTLREYIASITHDLSQPLSVINTAVYMLDKAYQDEMIQRRTASIKAQSVKMDSILHDIRQMSTLDTMSELVMGSLDMREFMQSIADYWNIRLTEQGHTFDYEALTERKRIIANAQLLERAISQVLQNALDHTGEAGKVALRCHNREDNLIIEIEDNGIGIDPEHQLHIFKRFYRVNKSRTASPRSGTGLGLPIAKRIMNLHGGDIKIESSPGKGSLFRLILPIQADEIAEEK